MSNLNDEVCEYNSTPTTENFAAKNGDGFVYHRSDCSSGLVKMYGNGGDWVNKECGRWLDPDFIKIVHERGFKGGEAGDHNWTHDELIAESGPNYKPNDYQFKWS